METRVPACVKVHVFSPCQRVGSRMTQTVLFLSYIKFGALSISLNEQKSQFFNKLLDGTEEQRSCHANVEINDTVGAKKN